MEISAESMNYFRKRLHERVIYHLEVMNKYCTPLPNSDKDLPDSNLVKLIKEVFCCIKGGFLISKILKN